MTQSRDRRDAGPGPLAAAALCLLLAGGLVSCEKLKTLAGGVTDLRNAQVDVSGTSCSDGGKFSTLLLKDGKFELGAYRFEMFGAPQHGNISGQTQKSARPAAVFVGTCVMGGSTSQVLFAYDDTGAPAKRLAVRNLITGGIVQSYSIKDDQIVVEENSGTPPRLSEASYTLIKGELVSPENDSDLDVASFQVFRDKLRPQSTWKNPACSSQGVPNERCAYSDGDTDAWISWGDLDDRAFSDLPAFRPWPPPVPSETTVIPNGELLRGLRRSPSLADVSGKLIRSLGSAGYPEYAFYRVPGGFAVVARLEQFDASDGAPVPNSARFQAPDAERPFSFSDYVSQLFLKAPPGFYRFLVFVVSDRAVVAGNQMLSAPQAEGMLVRGASALPAKFASVKYTQFFQMDVLVYEFLKRGNQTVARGVPGRFDARQHLRMSGIYAPLTGR